MTLPKNLPKSSEEAKECEPVLYRESPGAAKLGPFVSDALRHYLWMGMFPSAEVSMDLGWTWHKIADLMPFSPPPTLHSSDRPISMPTPSRDVPSSPKKMGKKGKERAEFQEVEANGPIYICQTSNGKSRGPFTMDQVCEWYQGGQILPSFLFSFDGGMSWESIHALRRKNGPSCPFIRDVTGFSNSIECLKRLTSKLKLDVDELEAQTERVVRKLEEEDKQLEKLKKQIEDRKKEREMSRDPSSR